MTIIPAIDLKEGKCVRLKQGRMNEATVYFERPEAAAEHWMRLGAQRIHLVDLDGAFAGRPENLEAIRAIRACVDIPLELGGGVRDRATAEMLFREGIDYVILGTAAIESRSLVEELATDFPGKVLVGIDAVGGRVAVRGWAEVTAVAAVDLAADLTKAGAAGFIFTDIERDGMQTGINLEATATFAKACTTPVIASGGVSTIDDIRSLLAIEKYGVSGVVTGRALYEGTLNLEDALNAAAGGSEI